MPCSSLVQLHRFDFHLRVFQRVEVASPPVPVDTVRERVMVAAVIVVTVQVGPMTAAVPPSTFV